MYWLIEDLDQLTQFYNSGYNEAFIEVIPTDHAEHPTQNSVSLVYIKPIQSSKGFILSIDHSETFNNDKTHIDAILKKFKVLYCRDKKEILHYFPLKTLYDINTPPTTYIRPSTKSHDIFYNRGVDNKSIPVVKHYELCEQIFNDLKDNIDKTKTDYDEFFNNRVSVVFNAIERSGIRVHVPRFEGYFHSINSERVYTQYNLKTLTTRPSNKFKGVNYAALNKDNGCRESFIPRNDKFIEIDISAYHPTLAAKLVGYKFPTSDIHSHFASLYKVDYQKAKELTFKQLYGGVFDNYKDLEFFSRIEKFVKNTWDIFNNEGYIECPISSFKLEKNKLDNMNPQKLFNYVLQNMETSQNVLALWDIFSILKGKKTRLVLYTYDSFLFDFAEEEASVIDKVREVFKKYDLNIKESEGYDYNFNR
jgi:hypothetical protein|tara:strand:+ start:293 stop:1552 length:1260 start_codon:yes stop_codon:yes gene_type:complete